MKALWIVWGLALLTLNLGCEEDNGAFSLDFFNIEQSADANDLSPSQNTDLINSDFNEEDRFDFQDQIELETSEYLQPRFEPLEEDFYRMPWPSNARLTLQGTPDLSDFPLIQTKEILEDYQSEIEAHVDGYSTMPVIYISFYQSLADLTLPTPPESLEQNSAIQLIDVDQDCGHSIPIEIQYIDKAQGFLGTHTLEIAPILGTVLKPKTTYALVIQKHFGKNDFWKGTQRPLNFQAALEGSDFPAWTESLLPLQNCWQSLDRKIDDIAIATVFTTQDPIGEMRILRNTVMDSNRIEVKSIKDWQVDENWSLTDFFTTYTGLIPMPIFQEGESPYNTLGGLVYDREGIPVIQRWEDVPMALTLPDHPIQTPIPLIVFIDGTGWSRWTHLNSNWIQEAIAKGYAIASFMPQFHGGRGGFEGDPALATFNFTNPTAGRTIFRQQAAETSYFIRVLREEIRALSGLPNIDMDRILYGGHSQGALVGALTAAVEDQYIAYVFSGLSAYLSMTAVYRADPVDFQALLRAFLGIREPIDRFHPVIQLIQLGGEAVDTHNYVSQWRGWAEHPQGQNIFVSNGFNDDTTVPEAIAHMTQIAHLDVVESSGWEIDPWGLGEVQTLALPISNNQFSLDQTPLTLATYLDPDGDHFVIYRRQEVRDMAIEFWTSAYKGMPTVELPLSKIQ